MRHMLFVSMICGMGLLFAAEDATPTAEKTELSAAKQRETILRAKLAGTETLAKISALKVETQARIDELQKQFQTEVQKYQGLITAAQKSCKADEQFDEDSLTCKAKVQAKAKEAR